MIVQTAPAEAGKAPERAAAALALPFERFTLANGLTVIVHTDRKAPVVAISVRYKVGAKYETPEHSGFAHLFEHIMFSRSAFAPEGYYQAMRELGATETNASTNYDDTAFRETVPSAALDRALFLEASRMGHMDTAITQAVLDNNRSVVQNEKRQNENQPNAIAYQRSIERLFPKGHPLDHTVIGSMASLNAASVEDARAWHRRYYRPGNAILVLSGDIDAATARIVVARRFGNLAPGDQVARLKVPIPSLPTPITDIEHDRVATTTVTRHWTTPGLGDADAAALDVAAKVLGTLTGAWLDQALLRDGLSSSVTTSAGQAADMGTFIVSYGIADGVDPARVSARLDTVLAQFARTGPSEDDIRRVVMRDIGWQTQGLETTGQQASVLGEGQSRVGNPLAYRDMLVTQARLTPRQVADAVSRWLLRRAAYTLTIAPGARAPYVEETAPAPPPLVTDTTAPRAVPAMRLPPIGPPAPLRFPGIERVRLSNGIEIVYAQRREVPLTRVALTFEGGSAADPPEIPDAQSLVLKMVSEGTADRDAAAVARARQRLGAEMTFAAGRDRSAATLDVPSTELPAAISMFADVVRHPVMATATLERVKADRLAAIRQSASNPESVAQDAMAPLLFGETATYGRNARSGDEAALAGLSSERMLALYRQWIRPDKAQLFVVSDLPLATVRAVAEHAFGSWQASGPPGKADYVRHDQATPRIVLIDRPDSPQSQIIGATRTPIGLRGDDDAMFAATVANEALGGFYGRIANDLRERRGWTYGVRGGFQRWMQASAYTITTSVQADRTGDTLAAIRAHMRAYVGDAPMTGREFTQAINAALAGLPGRYEDGSAVLAAMQGDQWFGRSDDYPATLPTRYRALDHETAMRAIRTALDPARMLWVVVGDARRVRAQLDRLGLPVVASAAGTP